MAKLSIKYTKSKNYVTTTATGVVGSMSPNGLVQCDFFVEKANLIEDQELEIDENGIPVSPDKVNVTSFTRELQSSLVMTPAIAKMIGTWLVKTSEEAEAAIKARE